jgi:hypothetical protein
MTRASRPATVLFIAAAGAIGSAQAQTYAPPYGQPPLYPYAVQQPYAVEAGPNTYVNQRPHVRNYPNIACVNCSRNSADTVAPKPSAPAFDRPRKPNDRALTEELRKRNTKKVVREKPAVRETTHVVEDPPRVIERRHIVEDLPPPAPSRRRAKASVEVGDEGQAKSAESPFSGPTA